MSGHHKPLLSRQPYRTDPLSPIPKQKGFLGLQKYSNFNACEGLVHCHYCYVLPSRRSFSFCFQVPLHLATLPFGRVTAQGALAFQMQQKSKYLVSCKTDPFELRSSLGFSKVDEAPCSRQFTDWPTDSHSISATRVMMPPLPLCFSWLCSASSLARCIFRAEKKGFWRQRWLQCPAGHVHVCVTPSHPRVISDSGGISLVSTKYPQKCTVPWCDGVENIPAAT